MAKVKIQGNASGTGVLTVTAPNTSTDRTITLPDSTGTLLTADGDGSSLTGVGVAGITSAADATAMTIDSNEHIGIGIAPKIITGGSRYLTVGTQTAGQAGFLELVGNRTANAGQDTAIMKFINNTTEIAEIGAYDNGSTNGGDLKFRTSSGGTSATAMTIDSNGHITAPKQPAFLVNARQSAPNLAVNANTTAQFTEEVYDVNADYNTSTYTFTAPVTGKYQFNVSLLWINWDASANYYYLKLVTSNRTYYELFNAGERSSDVTYAYGHIHVLADMDANDTAYIELFQNSGASQTNYENQSVFGGYLAC